MGALIRPSAVVAYYELEHPIGAGAMSRVYRAVHRPSGRRVAVKLPRVATLDAVDFRHLMLREASAVARLRHPNVVQLLDVLQLDDGRVALAFELVDGESLARWIRAWPGWDEVRVAVDDVLAALTAAHAVNVVHRDIKPQNILRERAGRFKVADFGVAALTEPLAEIDSVGEVGTPYYMAPEQAVQRGDVGPWTDLYAVGSLLYTLIQGAPPFRAPTLEALIEKKRSGPPALAPRVGLEIPEGMGRLVADLLQPEPRRRPRFATEVRERFASLASEVRDRIVLSPGGSASPRAHPIALDSSAEIGLRLDAPSDHARETTLSRLREPALVGRAAELGALKSAISAVIEGRQSRLLGFVGPAGAGKSALARWGLAHVESRALMESVSTRYDLSEISAGAGLRHALRRLLGTSAGASNDARFDWLRSDGALPFDARELDGWLTNEDSALDPAEAAELALEVLVASARQRPIYLWLDDLGWARDGGIELVERLLARPDAPVLVVATSRSGTSEHPRVAEQLSRLFAHARSELHELGSLDASERAALVSTLLPVDSGVAAEIGRRLDATPLVIAALVTDWASAGLLAAGADVEALLEARPPTRIMDQRIDALLGRMGERAEAAQSVLLRAAALGVAFEERSIRAVSAQRADVAGCCDWTLDQAVLAGLLRLEPNGVYRFDHALVRDALLSRLERLPHGASVLREVADGLLDAHGLGRPELVVHAAELLLRGGDASERPYRLIADGVGRLATRGRFAAARARLELASPWLEATERAELDLRWAWYHVARARLAYHACAWGEVEEETSAALETFAPRADDAGLRALDVLRMNTAFYSGRLAEARRRASAVIERAKLRDDPAAELQATHCLQEIASMAGDHDEALRVAARSVELAQATRDSQRIWVSRGTFAERLATVGHSEKAWALLCELEATAPAGEFGMQHDVADMRARVGLVSGLGKVERQELERRLARAREEGDHWRGSLLQLLLTLAVAEGEPPEVVNLEVKRLLAAFEHTPHDEALSLRALERLVVLLSGRGLVRQADRVAELLEARREFVRRGFEEPG